MNKKSNLIVALLVGLVLTSNGTGTANAQFDRIKIEPRIEVIQIGRVQRPSDDNPLVEGQAALKTDPELESILEQANRYKEDAQYDIASKLWQAVLERSGDALYSEDDQTYFSLVQQVERILANLPPDGGLATYRVTADANAKEILAASGDPYDVVALSKIVRRYFLSSLGDDAALSLSSLYMDEYDFVGAYRLLRKIVELYPDPSVSMQEVHSRIALCQSYFGEAEDAKSSIASAMKSPDAGAERMVELVTNSIGTISENRGIAKVPDGVSMPLGSVARYGVMPSIPRRAFAKDLVPMWQYYFNIQTRYQRADVHKIAPLTGTDAIESAEDTMGTAEKKMIDDWLAKQWRPAGHILIADEQVFFKTPLDVVAWNRNANEKSPRWRSVWQNDFAVDEYTKVMLQNGRTNRSRRNLPANIPSTANTVQMFSDQIAGQMSIQDGIFYSIEGKRKNPTDAVRRNSRTIRNHWNLQPRRARNNFLTAYNAKTGKVLWALPVTNDENEQQQMPAADDPDIENPRMVSGGFMAAPVHFNGLALVPVNQSGAISVYAIDPKQEGKTVWKSYLCDEPEAGANPFSPINLSLDGSDLFVSCGLGIVFVMDPSTGLVRFAKRYERQGEPNKVLRQYGRNTNKMSFNGWRSDTIIPYGRQMICFTSDSKYIEALDRKDGALIWRSEIEALGFKIDYLLGVYKDVLYAAGKQTLVAFDLKGEGRMKWGGDQLFDDEISYGRGMLTEDGIFIPVGKKIYKFDLEGLKTRPNLVSTANVDLGTSAPVGNLYSDGDKIWVHGVNRLYALKPGKRQKSKTPTVRDKKSSKK